MSHTRQCPSCGGRKLFVIPEVKINTPNGFMPFAAMSAELPAGRTGAQAVWKGTHDHVEVGPFGALVCAACGHTEWYAAKDALTTLADIAARSDAVRVIQEAEPPPYR